MGAKRKVVVVGAGIVGLATAHALVRRRPDAVIEILEKEPAAALHQSGHNSNVVHSGIYYRPGTLKARFCTEGRRELLAYCDRRGIPHQRVGKLILVTEPKELPVLEELRRRGEANGIPGVRRLSPEEISAVEPQAVARAALHVPGTEITDYPRVCGALVEDLRSAGVELTLGAEALSVRTGGDGATVVTNRGTFAAEVVVNCAGLFSDRLARRCGARVDVRIVPFRGEYYRLRPERTGLVRGLVYPVPDPEMPFLGVHLTRTVHGEVEAGPNAVLAWAREGYRKTTVRPLDVAEMAVFPGFARLARRYWRTGAGEFWRSSSPEAFAASVRKLVPAVSVDDLRPGGSGVRAQAVTADGRPVDDFLFAETPRAIHVLNSPSPAATSSFAIGAHIADKVSAMLREG